MMENIKMTNEQLLILIIEILIGIIIGFLIVRISTNKKL